MKTAIVIGNGESLKRTPLPKLRHDTFGCNRIHLLPFSPTYYVRVEPPQWDGTSQSFYDECRIHIANGEKCIFPDGDWQTILGDHPNIEWIKTCHHFKYPHTSPKFPRAWHLPYICDANTVITMMQIAVLKGYERIVLVGCDLEGGHFDLTDTGVVETERLTRLHETAKRDCPIPIYNATLGGRLNVYERIDIADL